MKNLIFIIFISFVFSSSYSAEAKGPVKQDDSVYTPVDTSLKGKTDPKEANEVKSLDVKALQERVDVIKNKVLDAKSKLIETTKDEVVTNAPMSSLTIDHKNNMSSRFSILNVTYVLDGKKIYSDYDLYRNKKDNYPIYTGYVAPGHHEIFIEMICSGSPESTFDYLKDYRIKTQNRYAFVIPNAKKIRIEGVSYESGTIFTSFKDRPVIEFKTDIE